MPRHRADDYLFQIIVPAEINAYQFLCLSAVLDVLVKKILLSAEGQGVVRLVQLHRFLTATLYVPVIALRIQGQGLLDDLLPTVSDIGLNTLENNRNARSDAGAFLL